MAACRNLPVGFFPCVSVPRGSCLSTRYSTAAEHEQHSPAGTPCSVAASSTDDKHVSRYIISAVF